MARVTVEDCIEKVADRFELVALAAQRAKDISAGAELKLERNEEKNTVLALREIAADLVQVEDLRENLVRHFQREHEVQHSADSEGTEISQEELDQEDFELKSLESAEIEITDEADVSDDDVKTSADGDAAFEDADISFEDVDVED
jgi:DNA-directed RNA polymerase subunit omega